MRITPKQYAQGLLSAIDNADTDQQPVILDRFFNMIVRERRTKDFSAILHHIEREMHERDGVCSLRIVSAKPLSHETIARISPEVKRCFAVNEVSIDAKVRSSALGGAVLYSESETIDASIGGRLRSFRRFLEE